MNPLYMDVLRKNPELDELLVDIGIKFSRPPIVSIMLTGGITLGSFTDKSDVDIVLIANRPVDMSYFKKIYQELKTDFKVDLLFVDEKDISRSTIPAKGFDRNYVLHEIDVILLKQHSVLLWGDNYKKIIYGHELLGVIDDTMAYVADNLVKPVHDISDDKLRDKIIPYVFVMARCIAAKKLGRLVSKDNCYKYVKGELKSLAELFVRMRNRKNMKINIENIKKKYNRSIKEFISFLLQEQAR